VNVGAIKHTLCQYSGTFNRLSVSRGEFAKEERFFLLFYGH
jgi:hypothetical protein